MTRTERTYYLVLGCYNLSQWFIAPVYPIFLLGRGLDLFEINVVLAVFLVTVCLFEVPTGAVADLVGRRASFLASCGLRTVAYGLYAFAEGFWDCIVAEVIDAIGMTLASGALDAWAVDGMRAEGDRRPTDRFFARAQMLTRALMIAGGVACGYVAEGSMTGAWLVSAAGFAMTGAIAAVTIREARRAAAAAPAALHRSLGRTAREGLAAVRAAPVLLLICGLTGAITFAALPIHMTWQARMQALTGEGVWLLGWVWALLNVTALAGSALLPRLLARLDRETVLAGAALWRATTLAGAAFAAGVWPALGGLVLQEAAFGLTEPVLDAWMNERVPSSERRATILSVRSMSATLGGAVGLLCLGLAARGLGIPAAWLAAAAVFALAAPGFVLLGRAARGVILGPAVGDAGGDGGILTRATPPR